MQASFRTRVALLLFGAFVGSLAPLIHAQELSKRLILKDGSYQLVTKWEVHGDRVRYLSAERNDWEELPDSLVDWPATDKYAKDRAAGVPTPEAAELDKEMEAERQAEEAKNPLVAPGLRLPEDGGVFLLDTFQSQPQLVMMQQASGELNRNRKGNILHAAINPIASSKQTIELDGLHATVQAHATLPSIYLRIDPEQAMEAASAAPAAPQPAQLQQPQGPQQPELPFDRFHIVRAQSKHDKRIVGDIKLSPLGKSNQEQNLVITTSQRLTGGWIKITPSAALPPGEYAVVEMLGREGMNTYVWDFGVNPNAPANGVALKPVVTPAPPPDQSKGLQPRRP